MFKHRFSNIHTPKKQQYGLKLSDLLVSFKENPDHEFVISFHKQKVFIRNNTQISNTKNAQNTQNSSKIPLFSELLSQAKYKSNTQMKMHKSPINNRYSKASKIISTKSAIQVRILSPSINSNSLKQNEKQQIKQHTNQRDQQNILQYSFKQQQTHLKQPSDKSLRIVQQSIEKSSEINDQKIARKQSNYKSIPKMVDENEDYVDIPNPYSELLKPCKISHYNSKSSLIDPQKAQKISLHLSTSDIQIVQNNSKLDVSSLSIDIQNIFNKNNHSQTSKQINPVPTILIISNKQQDKQCQPNKKILFQQAPIKQQHKQSNRYQSSSEGAATNYCKYVESQVLEVRVKDKSEFEYLQQYSFDLSLDHIAQ